MNKAIPANASASLASLILLAALGAQAAGSQVAVSTGYNDEPRNGVPYSIGSGQPQPWYGSANTTFYGNAAQAQAYDPDENAILLQNLGATPLSLTAASIGTYDLFVLDSIGGSVALNPGAYVILAGVDGSDLGSGLQAIGLTIGGNQYSYTDVATTEAPDGVLFGANPWIGGAETIPWTPVYTPRTGVPDQTSTLWLAGVAWIGLSVCRGRFGNRVSA